jgi:hypothetical protein
MLNLYDLAVGRGVGKASSPAPFLLSNHFIFYPAFSVT